MMLMLPRMPLHCCKFFTRTKCCFRAIDKMIVLIPGICTGNWKAGRSGTLLLRRCLHRRECDSQYVQGKGPPWGVVFFGSDAFAAETLRSLIKARTDGMVGSLEVVVHKKAQKPIVELVDKAGLTCHVWPYMPPTHHSFHVGVVVSFSRLLPESLIAAFPYGIVNVHPSLLPRWRGPAPIMHTVLSGDSETGVCIVHIRPHKYDVGPILLRQTVPVHHRCTTQELTSSLARIGADLLMRALRDLPENVLCSIPQDEEGGTLAPKPSVILAWVRWSQHTCEQVDRLHRALHERMPLRTLWTGQTLKILDLESPGNISLGQDVNHSAPGSLYFDKATRLLLHRPRCT
uniref:methionyl-tRNA formyltransferase, mitochondrial isoform X3 n=1 Tax=Myxine glutinosa TaxID=7769 RepID=UPI00358E1DC1